ncbi:hypothetical protein HGRIS_001098 [Hohenbuehelia grisea]|uniref:Uncharacterized protein n=1 Tax=Hohenbuehelia grisea TaxID=104357 RepID=A0ABR3JN96_9AGAR
MLAAARGSLNERLSRDADSEAEAVVQAHKEYADILADYWTPTPCRSRLVILRPCPWPRPPPPALPHPRPLAPSRPPLIEHQQRLPRLRHCPNSRSSRSPSLRLGVCTLL